MYDRKPVIECPLDTQGIFSEDGKSMTTIELELLKEYLEKNIDEHTEDKNTDTTTKTLQRTSSTKL